MTFKNTMIHSQSGSMILLPVWKIYIRYPLSGDSFVAKIDANFQENNIMNIMHLSWLINRARGRYKGQMSEVSCPKIQDWLVEYRGG